MKFPISSFYLQLTPLLALFAIPIASAIIGIRNVKLKSAIHFQQGTSSSTPWRVAVTMCFQSLPPFIVWCLFIPGPSSLFYLVGSSTVIPIVIFTISPIVHYIPSPSIVAYIQHRFQSSTCRKWISFVETIISFLSALFLLLHISTFLSKVSPYSFYLMCPLVVIFSIFAIIFTGHSTIMTISLILNIVCSVVGLGVFLYFAIEDVTSFSSIVPMKYSISNCFLSFFIGFLVAFYQLSASPSFYQIYFPLSTIHKLRLSLIFYGVFQLFSYMITFIIVSLFTAFLEKNCKLPFSYASFFLFTKMSVLHPVEYYLVVSGIISLLMFVFQWNILYLSTHIWEELAKFHFRQTSPRRQLSTLQVIIIIIGVLTSILATVIQYLAIPYYQITISILLITFTTISAICGIYACGYYLPCCNNKGSVISFILSILCSILLFYLFFAHNEPPNLTNSCDKNFNTTSVMVIRSFNMEKLFLLAVHAPLQTHPIIIFFLSVIICILVSIITGGQDQMVLDWNLVVFSCSSLLKGRSKLNAKRSFVESESFRYAQQATYPSMEHGIYH